MQSHRMIGIRAEHEPLLYRHDLSMFYNIKYAHREDSLDHAPDLLLKAQEYAQLEHRTMSELFREALRRYMAGKQQAQQWSALLQRTRAKGKALGITTEADVERLSDEYRRSKRRLFA